MSVGDKFKVIHPDAAIITLQPLLELDTIITIDKKETVSGDRDYFIMGYTDGQGIKRTFFLEVGFDARLLGIEEIKEGNNSSVGGRRRKHRKTRHRKMKRSKTTKRKVRR